MKLGVVSIDAAKIQANASLAANCSYETLAREVEKAATALDTVKTQTFSGLAKVHSGFTAAGIAHNLKKLWRHDRP